MNDTLRIAHLKSALQCTALQWAFLGWAILLFNHLLVRGCYNKSFVQGVFIQPNFPYQKGKQVAAKQSC